MPRDWSFLKLNVRVYRFALCRFTASAFDTPDAFALYLLAPSRKQTFPRRMLRETRFLMISYILKGGTSRAQWEDVTGSTPLTFVNDCVSFTTTVSARFWLMDCRNIGDATKMATELYRYVRRGLRTEANLASRVWCVIALL